MDIAGEIKHLLEVEWDYKRGLEIYHDHGGNQALYGLLSKDPDSPFFNKKLKQELSQLDIDVPSVTAAVINKSVNPIKLSDWPKELQPLVVAKNELVKEQNHLQSQITLIKSEEERMVSAFRILDLDDLIAEYWRQIEFFRAHNHFIPELPVDDIERLFFGVEDGEIRKILTNHRTYLTKANKGERSADKIPHYQAVIAEAERRLDSV